MWVRSSFEEGLAPTSAPSGVTRRRPRPNQESAGRSAGDSAALWAERHAPSCPDQLAVQRAKVEEVETWLTAAQRRRTFQSSSSPLLLLTGPAGAGKSACLRALVSRLRLQLLEWTCQPTARHRSDNTFRAQEAWEGPGDSVCPEGQLRRFGDFLLRAGRYSCVLGPDGGDGDGRLVLVDELPNALLLRRDQFYDILRRYSCGGRCPCVFVLSDGGALTSDLSASRVFPEAVQRQLGMHQITFRPVASRQLVAAMERVLKVEASSNGGAVHPGKPALEQLAAASSGDVRAAINALQFLAEDRRDTGVIRKRSRAPAVLPRGKEKRPKQQHQQPEELAAVGSRDASLGLFRALGKIIYAKRGAGEEPPLPPRLSALQRRPSLEREPELVAARAGVLPTTLLSHLHHNYAEFCPQLQEAVVAADHLSHADLVTADWQSRSSTLAYGSSVAARGIMFSRPHSVSLGFRQFSQPRLTNVEEQRLHRWQQLRDGLADWRLSGEALVCDLLPHLRLRRPGYTQTGGGLSTLEVDVCRRLYQPQLLGDTSSDDEASSDSITIEEYDE